jgi:GGDEF domain-containing protein
MQYSIERKRYQRSSNARRTMTPRRAFNRHSCTTGSSGFRNAVRVTVVFIDLDHFKFVNAPAQRRRRVAAQRRRGCADQWDGDTVVRLGGDSRPILKEQARGVIYRAMQRIRRGTSCTGIATASPAARHHLYLQDGPDVENAAENAGQRQTAPRRRLHNFQFTPRR